MTMNQMDEARRAQIAARGSLAILVGHDQFERLERSRGNHPHYTRTERAKAWREVMRRVGKIRHHEDYFSVMRWFKWGPERDIHTPIGAGEDTMRQGGQYVEPDCPPIICPQCMGAGYRASFPFATLVALEGDAEETYPRPKPLCDDCLLTTE